MFNKKQGISLHLTHSELGLPSLSLCSSTRSEVHVETCWSQALSKTAAQLCCRGKQDSSQMSVELRLLGRAGDTSQAPGRSRPALSVSQDCRNYLFIQTFGECFPIGPGILFLSWLGKKLKVIISYSQALSKLDSYVKESSILRLHDCTFEQDKYGWISQLLKGLVSLPSKWK